MILVILRGPAPAPWRGSGRGPSRGGVGTGPGGGWGRTAPAAAGPDSVDPGRGRWQSGADMARPPHPVNRASGPVRPALPRLGLLLALAAPAALGGCSLFEAPREIRGNRVDEALLSQITPGVQTKQDVSALLGSPSTTGTFDNEHWYYISSITHIRPGRTPGSEDQKVIAITFDPNGVVREVKALGEEDRRDVAFVDRQTPVPGNDRTVLQQLFSNIGRFGGGGSTSGEGPGGGPGR